MEKDDCDSIMIGLRQAAMVTGCKEDNGYGGLVVKVWGDCVGKKMLVAKGEEYDDGVWSGY